MTPLIRAYGFVEDVLFGHGKTGPPSRFRFASLLALYLLGVAHWINFFHGGELSFTLGDWAKEAVYLNTLREALTGGVIPWQWSQPLYHHTQNFLAIPEVSLTPDIVLLRWLPNGAFVIIHLLLFYSAGFLGSLSLAKKMDASLLSFLFLWLLFNFNGFITAHLAVGHFQWTGYFLLPTYFLILSRLVESNERRFFFDPLSSLSLGLLLGLLFLNGSFHIAIWCLMFMAIALVWKWAMLPNVLAATLAGGLLGFGRLLPASRMLGEDLGYDVRSGYPGLSTLLDAFTSVREYSVERMAGIWGGSEWWEYDLYVGFLASALLAVTFALALKRRWADVQLPLFAAAGVMLLFSFGSVYSIISTAPLPLAAVERVPSRFIVMPFLFLLITAARGAEELFRSGAGKIRIAALVSAPVVAWELFSHSVRWRVYDLEQAGQKAAQPLVSLVRNSDLMYFFYTRAGWIVSALSLLGVLAVLLLYRRTFLSAGREALADNLDAGKA